MFTTAGYTALSIKKKKKHNKDKALFEFYGFEKASLFQNRFKSALDSRAIEDDCGSSKNLPRISSVPFTNKIFLARRHDFPVYLCSYK